MALAEKEMAKFFEYQELITEQVKHFNYKIESLVARKNSLKDQYDSLARMEL